MSRQYDIALYGATGFTGKLAAKYVVQNCPTDLSWAVSGRSQIKLINLVNEVKPLNVNRRDPGVIVADANDLEALTKLARSTKVVVSFAGPFALYGSKLVQACAENGTHYADITGESPWVRELIQRHHLKPAPSPSIIVPSCGFDSIPSDLGTTLLLSEIQKKYPSTKIKSVRVCITEIASGISGGSIASMINLVEHYSLKDIFASLKPFGLSPIKPRQITRGQDVVYDGSLGGWMGPWLMSNVNAATVCRTYGLLQGKWGENFSYMEYLVYGSWWRTKVMSIGLKAFGVLLSVPPVRWMMKRVLRGTGEGPSHETMVNGRLVMKINAETDEVSAKMGRMTVSAEADPAYLLTAMMIVESGLLLAKEVENTEVWKMFYSNGENQSVVVTPGLLGERLQRRLENGGLNFTLDV